MKVLQSKKNAAKVTKGTTKVKAGSKVKELAKVKKAAPAKVKTVQESVNKVSIFKTAPELSKENLLKVLKTQGSLDIPESSSPRSTKLLGEIKVTPEFEVTISGVNVVMVSLQNADGTEFTGNGVHLPVKGQPSERGYGKHVVQEGAIPKQFRRGYGRTSGIGFFFDTRLGYARLKRFDEGSYEVPSGRVKKTVKRTKK